MDFEQKVFEVLDHVIFDPGPVFYHICWALGETIPLMADEDTELFPETLDEKLFDNCLNEQINTICFLTYRLWYKHELV